MGRKAAPQPLPLGDSVRPSDGSRAAGETIPHSATSPRSPRSPIRHVQTEEDCVAVGEPMPLAHVLHQPRKSPNPREELQQQQRPDEAREPPQPSPRGGGGEGGGHSVDQQQQLCHRHRRRGDDKASKSGFFFNFGKSTKSSDRPIVHQYPESRVEAMSRDSDRLPLSKQSTKHSDSSSSLQKPNTPLPSRSEVSLASTVDFDSAGNSLASSKKSSKPKPFNLLGRTRSFKDKDSKDSPSPKDHAPIPVPVPPPTKAAEPERPYTSAAAAPRTAPLQARDRSFREMMSAVRNHSAERSQPGEFSGKGRDQEKDHHQRQHHGYTQTPGGAFFSNLKHSKTVGILSNRLFGGGSRHEPPAPKEPVVDDEHYVLKVINLPLVEQTRRTRISKRLEDSRDKTEFWMPAFPWRAIDYLNYKGSEVEGLYRVPGSGPQIKKWQRKFDEELDVDLFEQTDLYDINIIGSMLKAWLRELPDELFPKEAQDRISRECAGAEKVPQLLIEELSNLPPFNYYLLFAITCHLSLLLAHSEKNKMDFRNLCICFQPCMKIDAFCFKFLVCDWRECWKGCKNEAKYIEEEYALFDQPPPKAASDRGKNGAGKVEIAETIDEKAEKLEEEKQEERNISSSDSSKSPNSGEAEQKGRPKKPLAESESAETSSTISTTLTYNSERETPPRKPSDLRPLSPIKPLSPLNF